MAKEIWELEEREPTQRELLFAEHRQRFDENLKRVDDMILTVLKAQIVVERSMTALLDVYGRDPKHFFFTKEKIKECKKIDPPEVDQPIWDLLSKCSYVRNELAHSLNDEEIKRLSEDVREAYIAVNETEREKQAVRDMTHTQVVMGAIYHCGMFIMLATDAKEAADKQAKSSSSHSHAQPAAPPQ
ncbi:hypothetical protein LRP30_02990 [Bradyrhizobium sp. C-145]|uniref:hypothetical protein n=1 Tax=Bradyrhizobium sp. C-145 TaxID=574727 RepID=UPI00201B5F2F|nr:hypothetical protein [Bradyrhizobium sp. C-145]UQR64302.1 hypothetical protein LRP30_02990 [Bradyrhizobium sp. C-145]